MNILAIDTATEVLGLAVLSDSKKITVQANIGFRHGESLFPWTDRIFRELGISGKQTDLVICTTGPGSFTGLRIGLATAKGIAMAADCPIAGITTLDLYAAAFGFFKGLVIPLVDARKNRYYTACYKDGKRTSEYMDLSIPEIEKLAEKDTAVLYTGPNADAMKPFIDSNLDKRLSIPKQADMSLLIELGKQKLAMSGPMDYAEGPLYLRRSEAEIHHEKMNSPEQHP